MKGNLTIEYEPIVIEYIELARYSINLTHNMRHHMMHAGLIGFLRLTLKDVGVPDMAVVTKVIEG